MFSRKGTRVKGEYGVVVDVRPSSVGIAVVASHRDKPLPEIIAHARIETPFFTTADGHEFRPLVEETFHRLEQLFHEHIYSVADTFSEEQHISYVIVSVTAPWSHVASRTVVYEKEQPFKITEALLIDLVAQAEKDIDTKMNEPAIAGTFGFTIGARSILQEYVNDYAVDTAIGKRGRSLKLTHATNLIATPLQKSIAQFTEDIFPHVPSNVYAHLFTLFAIVHKERPELQSFAVVNITDEVTEIGIVKNGTIRYTTHVPFGSETLIRTIADTYNVPRADVLSRLEGVVEGVVTEEQQQQCMKVCAAYKEKIQTVVSSIFDNYYIPHTILTVAPNNAARVLVDQVTNVCIATGNETLHSIDMLDGKQFPWVDIHEDTALALLAWFLHIQHRRV